MTEEVEHIEGLRRMEAARTEEHGSRRAEDDGSIMIE